MKSISLKQSILPHVIAYVIFLATVVSFFSPIFFQNKKLFQGDIPHHEGIAKQIIDYRKETGKEALWNNRVFSGMPAYLLDVQYQEPLTHLWKALASGFMPSNVGYIFIAMLAAYILLLSFGVSTLVAISGGLAYGMSTFTLISIGVGHDGKVDAMAWIPFVIAGVHIAYHKNRWWGAILTASGLMVEIAATHPQINYYLILILIIYVISQLAVAIQTKNLRSFSYTSAVLCLAALLAIGANFGRLWTIYEYGHYSIRGQSELTVAGEGTASGLDKDYAFKWSLGKLETLTLLIPNFYGGSSHTSLGENSYVAAALKKRGIPYLQIRDTLRAMPTYWGDQPFTEGPMYLGILTGFLFCWGLWIVDKPYRYWLLAITVLAVCLAWGKNWSVWNDWMYAYFPGYNKFRAVTTAMVMAQVSSVLMAALALQEIIKQGFTPTVRKGLIYTVAIIGSIWILGLDVWHGRNYSSYIDSTLPGWLANALQADRKLMVQQDIVRGSLLIGMLGLLLGGYYKKRIQASHLCIGIGILMWLDYYGVGKRYIRDTSYKSQAEINRIDHTPAKAFIEQDKTMGYRVFNLNNPFNDGRTSYYFSSVGGYHSAKLRRYQDLIEHCLKYEHTHILSYISGEVPSLAKLPVLNMLNAKYFIYAPQQGGVITNAHVLGNAWFVQAIQPVGNPWEEISTLRDIDLAHTAVIDTTKFAITDLNKLAKGTIYLQVYQPNYLVYEAHAVGNGLAVFSEIYYPKGWQAYIDNKPVEIIRANYVLRALAIPAGKHIIQWKFEPGSYRIGSQIMLVSSLLLSILWIICIIYSLKRWFSVS